MGKLVVWKWNVPKLLKASAASCVIFKSQFQPLFCHFLKSKLIIKSFLCFFENLCSTNSSMAITKVHTLRVMDEMEMRYANGRLLPGHQRLQAQTDYTESNSQCWEAWEDFKDAFRVTKPFWHIVDIVVRSEQKKSTHRNWMAKFFYH